MDFGFTTNQAKVYLSIVQSGRTRVGRISKNTQLHRQDIYKLLPKLEKMGLITKTIDKPFMIEAIPFQKALENVILKEREKANQKIMFLERNLREIVDALQNQPELKEEARFTLLSTDEAIKNKGKFIFKKLRKQFFLVTPPENIVKPGLHYYSDLFRYIADHKAKLRILLISADNKGAVKQVVDKLASKNATVHVKLLQRTVSKNFQIIDNQEAWVATQQLPSAHGRPGFKKPTRYSHRVHAILHVHNASRTTSDCWSALCICLPSTAISLIGSGGNTIVTFCILESA